jgi:glycosyltransferase involved in cell wall biosynthesis
MSQEPRGDRLRILFAQYKRHRFCDIDASLLGEVHAVERYFFPDRRDFGWRGGARLWRKVRRCDAAVCWFADYHATILALFCRLLRKPLLLIGGGYDVVRMPGIGYGLACARGPRILARVAFQGASRIVTNSHDSKRELFRHYRQPLWKIRPIHHGVSVEGIDASGIDWPREPIAVTAGKVKAENLKRKGLEAFVRAAAFVPGCRFVVVGEVAPDGEEALRPWKVPNLELAGFLEDRAMVDLFRRARYYVQVSHHEGFGMALAEAMLCGCFPIVSDRGAIPEVVGGTGAYVEVDRPEQIAAVAAGREPSREEHLASGRRVRDLFSMRMRREELLRSVRALVHR